MVRCELLRVMRFLPLVAVIATSNELSILGQKPSPGGGQAGQQATLRGDRPAKGAAQPGFRGCPIRRMSGRTYDYQTLKVLPSLSKMAERWCAIA